MCVYLQSQSMLGPIYTRKEIPFQEKAKTLVRQKLVTQNLGQTDIRNNIQRPFLGRLLRLRRDQDICRAEVCSQLLTVLVVHCFQEHNL